MKEWAPLAGDEYAGQIAQATLWRMLRVPCVLILLIPINVLGFLGTWAADITVITSAVLVVVAGVGLPLVTRSQLRAISRRMAFNLEREGRTLSSMPDLRKSDEFQSWCADEGFTAEDIKTSAPGPRP
jgi:small-conductance mechanosensitive channel